VEKLRRAEFLLSRLEKGLLVFLLSAMVLLSFSQVLMRQLFHTGLLWGDTLLRHLVVWVGLLGASLATMEGKHFAWEPAVQKSGKSGAIMHLAAHSATAVVTALLIKASWSFWTEERLSGNVLFSVANLSMPAWIFSAFIPLGFFLILLHTLLRLTYLAAEIRK
jgi:TRAP-type C4-dicarboxylate transport system permease small subunit